MGLVHALLVALAKAGQLEPAKEGAKIAMKQRMEKLKEKGSGMDE
jgi:ubiquitin carboxyl-terminal hydrolase L5